MPVFECSRCNQLTYSSSKTNTEPCDGCGAQRKRVVQDATSFAEARQVPRAVSHGDHSIGVFDEFEQVADVAADFIRHGLCEDALVIVAVAQELEDLVLARLDPREQREIAWEPPTDTYGPLFWPPDVIARFRGIAEREDRPVFVLGCPDEPLQNFTSLEGWIEYERMAHELAVEHGMAVLCLYDARLHDERMLRAGLATHALEADLSENVLRRNEAFDYEPPSAA